MALIETPKPTTQRVETRVAAPAPVAAKPAEVPDKKTEVNVGDALRDRLGIKSRVKKPDEKPAEKVAVAGDKKPEEKVAPKKKDKAKPAPAAAPPIDANTIATAVTAGVTAALKKDEPKKVEPTDGLTDDEKETFDVLKRMESKGLEASGKSDEYLKMLKNLATYRKDWEGKNPGSKFDIKDTQHNDFVAENDVAWDDVAFNKESTIVKINSAVGKVREEMKGEMESKLGEVKASEKARELAPQVVARQVESARTLFKELGDDFKNILTADGRPDGVEIKRLIDENPIYEKVLPLANAVETVSGEIFKIARGVVPFNVEKNELHKHILDFIVGQENSMKEMPPEDQRDQAGKMFATSDEWAKLTPAQQKEHWHFNDADLSMLYTSQAAKQAKTIIEKEEANLKKLAEKRGYTVSNNGKPAAAAPAATARAAAPAEREEASPAGAIAPRSAPQKKVADGAHKPLLSRIMGR